MNKPFEQQIFDGVIRHLRSEGMTVYPELPLKEVPYPFAVVGEVQIVPKATLSRLLGKVFVTVDVWGGRRQRKDVSTFMTVVYRLLKQVDLDGCTLILDVSHSSGRTLADNSTNETLWHGIVSLEFNII